ncbi:YkgJ family cysteine cluster protein [Candidatus Harpocratesius sp.]
MENYHLFGKKLMEKCNNCGNCCTASQEGDVLIFPLDFHRLLKNFQINPKLLISRYLKIIEYEYFIRDENFLLTEISKFVPVFSIRMQKKKGCPFYNSKSKKCNVYSARPDQCRFFPFIYCILEDSVQLHNMYDSCRIINSLFQALPQKKKENNELFLPIEFINKIVEKERKIEHEYYTLLKKQLFTHFNLVLDDWDNLSTKKQIKILLKIYSKI